MVATDLEWISFRGESFIRFVVPVWMVIVLDPSAIRVQFIGDGSPHVGWFGNVLPNEIRGGEPYSSIVCWDIIRPSAKVLLPLRGRSPDIIICHSLDALVVV